MGSYFGREGDEPILVREPTYIESVAEESYPLFILLRHRTVSSPICLSEAIRKPFALSRVFLLSSGGKSTLLVKKKRLHVVIFSIYARRFKDQARKSKYPRT